MSMVKGIVVGVIIGLLLGVGVGYGALAGQLSARDIQITSLQGQVATRDAQITALQSQLVGNTTLATRLQGWLSGNLTLITTLQTQVASLQTQLAGNITLLTQLQTWLSGNLTLVGQLQSQVASLQTQLAGNTSLTMQLQTWLSGNVTLLTQLNANYQKLLTDYSTLQGQRPHLIAVSFSRYEYTRGVLTDLIDSANQTIHVMVMALTADGLADALINASNRGVNVTVIIDDQYKTSTGSDYGRILAAGIDIRTDNSWRLMHHKVMVVDGYIIVTGSYNWSAAAEDDNWENIIILESTTISDTYMEEFNRIWQQTTPGA